MKSVSFSVESNSILLEAIDAMKDYQGHDIVGMCMGLDMVRRGLGLIGLRALELNDPQLTKLLIDLCVLRPTKDGTGTKLTVET